MNIIIKCDELISHDFQSFLFDYGFIWNSDERYKKQLYKDLPFVHCYIILNDDKIIKIKITIDFLNKNRYIYFDSINSFLRSFKINKINECNY